MHPKECSSEAFRRCEKNPDVERFLKQQTIEFTKIHAGY
jgi:hypothetical protein